MGKIKQIIALLGYAFWLMREIAKSSISVTKLIWQRRLSITPNISWITTKQQSDVARVIFANSITLTPGTITICVEDDRLLVHSLTKDGRRDLQDGEMDNRIRKALC